MTTLSDNVFRSVLNHSVPKTTVSTTCLSATRFRADGRSCFAPSGRRTFLLPFPGRCPGLNYYWPCRPYSSSADLLKLELLVPSNKDGEFTCRSPGLPKGSSPGHPGSPFGFA